MTTKPTIDPTLVYPDVPGINYDLFKLTEQTMDPGQYNKAREELKAYADQQQSNFLGYQTNQQFNYESYAPYLNCLFNNIGDPFVSGNFTMNTKFMERAVLDYFASLWNARWPYISTDPESYWGYVVSMGSSESNIFGFWNARDYLAGRKLVVDPKSAEKARLASMEGKPCPAEPRIISCQAQAPADNPNMYTPVAFYSQDTHYSVIKCMRMEAIKTFYEMAIKCGYKCPLNITTPGDYPPDYAEISLDPKTGWPYEVPSNADGSIYIPALVKLVEFFAKEGYPIIVNFNYGTTFKGAYDNVDMAIEQLRPILKNNGLYQRKVEYEDGKFDIRNGFWFHVDGALGAGYMPYKEMISGRDFPVFDFRIPEVCSITMSGHKFPGAPWPCGVYMSKVKYQLVPPSNPIYLGAPDSTLSGSRNGFSAMILWEYLTKHSYEDSKHKTDCCQSVAGYLTEQLKQYAYKTGKDIWVEHTENALSVRFKKANPKLIFKYSLSSEALYVNGQPREYNHIYCMEHVTREFVDRFIEDLMKDPNPFPEQ